MPSKWLQSFRREAWRTDCAPCSWFWLCARAISEKVRYARKQSHRRRPGGGRDILSLRIAPTPLSGKSFPPPGAQARTRVHGSEGPFLYSPQWFGSHVKLTLRCQGVIRDVIKRYEQHEKSRFAGRGHEYHCIDYIRQSIMCSGDMTLDYAELQEDGTRRGFSGANSTHQCRDWDAIVSWAEENREGDKKGIA